MRMPPTTPRGVLRELASQPITGLRIARWWIIIGTLVALFGCAMAVAHFVYDVPIQNENTGIPATGGEVVAITSLLSGGGLFFVVAGIALRRWLLNRLNGS
ncbi:hypothetical protein [Sphingomonas sp. CCH5-D11]|uniref:hypothetical protein n=1 Tax=Sphingomonas sp. CCH5-D11 TaxID=1768786 RepID=UPI0012E36686|nr:hypothetical protein [Sphingomonas sp. CCH5-D11]